MSLKNIKIGESIGKTLPGAAVGRPASPVAEALKPLRGTRGSWHPISDPFEKPTQAGALITGIKGNLWGAASGEDGDPTLLGFDFATRQNENGESVVFSRYVRPAFLKK